MEGDSSEFSPKPHSEYATTEEVERARRGAAEFQHVLENSSFKEKWFLTHSDTGQRIQSMFLGLKPVAGVDFGETEKIKDIPFPKRFHIDGDHLYDDELASDVIQANPDIFGDLDLSQGVNPYMHELLSQNPAASRDPGMIKKIGLLYGFPKDAVTSYADNISFWSYYIQRSAELANYILRREALGEASEHERAEEEVILHFARMDRKGRMHFDEKYYEEFIDTNTDTVRKFLETQRDTQQTSIANGHGSIFPTYTLVTNDRIEYLIGNRGEHMHGFDYGTGIPTPETLAFPQKVEDIYRQSGIKSTFSPKLLMPFRAIKPNPGRGTTSSRIKN